MKRFGNKQESEMFIQKETEIWEIIKSQLLFQMKTSWIEFLLQNLRLLFSFPALMCFFSVKEVWEVEGVDV